MGMPILQEKLSEEKIYLIGNNETESLIEELMIFISSLKQTA